MPTQRHILFLNEFFHPDICASATVLTDRLPVLARLRSDWKITVITGNRAWDDASVVYPAEDELRGVRVVRVNRPAVSRTSLIRRALGFWAFQRGAVRAARDLGPIDLVINTTAPPQGAGVARRIADLHGCPYIYTVLDLYPDLAATLGRIKADGFWYARWLARDTKVMQRAAAVVSITERIGQRIAATRPVPSDKLLSIHDGFDPARIAVRPPGRAVDDFRARFNPEGRFVVQYAGNMGLSHPFDTILAAARALADDAGILFQFVGDGPQRPFIAANLPRNARLIGYQPAEALGGVLSCSDICLISQHEDMFDKALPYKIYATLAAGKPCLFVGNERSEIAGWLGQSRAGLQVNQGDADQLAAAIRELKGDAGRREEMGRAARALFDARFHVEKTAGAWVALIERILGP